MVGVGAKAKVVDAKYIHTVILILYPILTFLAFRAYLLKYGSEEKGSSLCRCSILLGFILSKKQERLRSELLSEDKITNLLGFLT